jgi:hypothetical protein
LTGLLGAEDGVKVIAEWGSDSGARKSGEDDGVLHLDGDVFGKKCKGIV